MTVVVNSQNFETEVIKSEKPVIVDVFATWCGPCKQIEPIFDELSKELSGQYTFAKLNIDNDRDIAIQHSVSSIPTFLFIKGGEVVARETGYMSKEVLKDKLETIFK
ncbi:MAG: thioredoxin [Epsilonproteobacteria bacterium]|nr:thioredoxin [Campylobacterota bacterium]